MSDPTPDMDELRPLTPEEAAKVEAYPLPDGTPDALVNRYLLKEALGKSLTTIDAYRHAGMPVETEGTNGKNYEYRLSLCWAWVCEREATTAAKKQHAEDAVAQMRLALTGGGAGAEERARLTPKEQKELLEVEVQWMIAARHRGELIHMDEVVTGVEAMLIAIREGVDSLPDRLERECNLDGKAVEAATRICDAFLSSAVNQIKELIGHDEAGGEQL